MNPKPNLDLLRGIAVLLVVVEHTLLAKRILTLGPFPIPWIGVVGVFTFFVHTSLVLMWSLERKPHVLDFYIRRVFRIYPLAIVAILIALLFRAPVAGSVQHYFLYLHQSRSTILSNLLLIQNLLPRANMLGVMWTLPLELQMYLLLPALFFLARRERAVWPILVLWVFACAIARSLFDKDASNFLAVVPDFLPGVVAYIAFTHRRPTLPPWLLPLFFATLATLFLLHPDFHRGWIFSLALGLALPSFRQFTHPWIVRPSHELAKYSYGLYLMHPFSIVLGLHLLASHSLALQIAVEIVSLAVFSIASYHLVEKPLIRLGTRVAARAERWYEYVELSPNS